MTQPDVEASGADTGPLLTRSSRLDVLVCPRCRAALDDHAAALQCSRCGDRFQISNGIVRFIATDSFYEGAYQATIKYLPSANMVAQLGLYVLDNHYLWWVRRHVHTGARLLELGCGGGVRYFARRCRATGLDLSFRSLTHLDPEYELALQADALNLPLAGNTYDAVAAAYFYEHVSPSDKPRLLEEIRRVLRPGGKVILLFDVESHNPLFRWLRKDADRYRTCFVDHDHHYGLEPAEENLARFERSGFRVLGVHLANKTPLQHLAVYSWMRAYDHPALNAAATAAERLARVPALCRGYGVGLTLFDDLVEPLLPRNWARIMLVALEKA